MYTKPLRTLLQLVPFIMTVDHFEEQQQQQALHHWIQRLYLKLYASNYFS